MTLSSGSPSFQERFNNSFSLLQDPRRLSKGNIRYPLEEIVFMVISAVVCGATDWTVISDFGKSQLDWLRKYFPYEKGVCSHDVLGNVFGALDVECFERCFGDWVSASIDLGKGELISIDGKTLRGSYDNASGKQAIHMVSAFASSQGVSLAQVGTSGKGHEISAINELLGRLDLKGCTVTIDAIGCQTAIVEKIISKGGDYILAVKANQAELLEQVEKVLRISPKVQGHLWEDVGHGRVEKRLCKVASDLRFLDGKEDWMGIKSVVSVKADRYEKLTGKSSNSTRYYISSKNIPPEQMNRYIRSHWAIENGLHWQLDVIFGEDASRKRAGNSAANFNLILKTAQSILQRDGQPKISKKRKSFKAAMDSSFREKIMQL